MSESTKKLMIRLKSRLAALSGGTARMVFAKEEYHQAQQAHRTPLTQLNSLQAEADGGTQFSHLPRQ